MSGIELLSLKQKLTQLTETERREMSAYLVRLGQESGEWKQETSRRLEEMKRGNKISSIELRKKIENE